MKQDTKFADGKDEQAINLTLPWKHGAKSNILSGTEQSFSYLKVFDLVVISDTIKTPLNKRVSFNKDERLVLG